MKKGNCAFLTRTSQQGKKAGQRQVKVGPELLTAAPAQVIRKMGLRPVLELYCFREPRH